MRKLLIAMLSVFIVFSNTYYINAEENDENQSTEVSFGQKVGYLAGLQISNYRLYVEKNFLLPGGTGFAFEEANNLSDILHGKDATVIGGNNATNGADRIIKVKGKLAYQIQDKCFSTATRTVEDAFENGTYRYIDSQGNPMLLEVPKDQYDDAVLLFQDRIENGQVPGVTDPLKAKEIVQKGKVTFKQAQNIAKAGNIDSLIYDAKQGAIISSCVLGISFAFDFASNVLVGNSVEESLKNATLSSIKAGVFTELVYITSSQLAKTGAASVFAPAATSVANLLGPNAQATIMHLFANNSHLPNVTNVANVLKSQMLIQAVVLTAMTIPDVINVFNGRISRQQLGINLCTAICGMVGGTVGMIAGGTLGSTFIPGVGTTIGGIAGGVVGGAAGTWGAQTLLKTVFQPDADQMYNIIVEEFQKQADEYLVNQEEADSIVVNLQAQLTDSTLKDMFQSEDREQFARDIITPLVEETIKERDVIHIPSFEETRKTLKEEFTGIAYIH